MKKERDVRTWTNVTETGIDGQPVLGGGADYAHIFLAKFPYPGKIIVTILDTLWNIIAMNMTWVYLYAPKYMFQNCSGTNFFQLEV